MNTKINVLAALLLIMTFAVGDSEAQANSTSGGTPKATSRSIHPKPKEHSSVEWQIEELRREIESQRQAMESQQGQIQTLKQQLLERDARLDQAQQATAATKNSAKQEQQLSNNAQQVENLQSSVADIKTSIKSVVSTVQEQQTQAVRKSELSDLAFGKVKIGGLFYGDYAYYNQTGFGPQFLTQLNQEGPGNDGFNSFDITRTYLNVLYTPVNAITLRITPNIYRAVNGSSSAIADGSNAQISGSTNGNLGFRLKYAYVQFNTPFSGSQAFKKGNIRLGQTMNPLVDWEEALYGYRFVNLTPWNYLSLSSTYVGAEVNGPIEVNGKEYFDYQIGVFNTASFHAVEQNDKKQAMGRLTWYPFGTKVDRTGFGLTVFENYGYNTKTPDTKSTPLNRLAILAHYQSTQKGYEIAGEYDLGRNAISTGQLFSGAGPASTGTYAAFSSLASALVAGDSTRQQGYAVFGHAQLGKSPFKVFGMVHGFQPNTTISGNNPLDFRRTVGGISYDLNKYLTFALDDQNLTYTSGQFTMTAAQIATFSPSLATTYPNGIPNAVPSNTNAIFMNAQFSY